LGFPALGAEPARMPVFLDLAIQKLPFWREERLAAREAPFSPLLRPEEIERAVDEARSLDELADIAQQALHPAARHARGADRECAVLAWQLWSLATWTLAAAPDGVTTWQEQGKGRTFVEPSKVAALQWEGSKRLIKGLAFAMSVEELALSLGRMHAENELWLRGWAQEHASSLVPALPEQSRMRVEIDRQDGQASVEVEASWEMRSLSNLVFGEDLAQALRRPPPEAKGMEPPEFERYCRALSLEADAEREIAKNNGMDGASGSDAKAHRLVDELLPADNHNLGALAALLANRFGLRSVSARPMGGAQKARQELTRAFGAFEALAERVALPSKSVGLGGLRIQVGMPRRVGMPNNTCAAYFRAASESGQDGPGLMDFSAPFRFLAHEWTHAWDLRLAIMAKGRLTTEQAETMDKALESARKTALFEETATRHAAIAYARALSKPVKNDWLNYINPGLDEPGYLLETCRLKGTAETQRIAQEGRLPPKMKREIRDIWRACERGSEKQIRAALLVFANQFEWLGGEDDVKTEGWTPQAWAMDFAFLLSKGRQDLRDQLSAMEQAKEAGPMKWEAAWQDRRSKAQKIRTETYWGRPSELLARAAETFFSHSDTPSLSLVDAKDWLRPKGEEAARMEAEFKAFFSAAKPAFESLATLRADCGDARPMASISDFDASSLMPRPARLDSALSRRAPDLSLRQKKASEKEAERAARGQQPK
jgi:hypothetical protein